MAKVMANELLDAPLAELMAAAARRRDANRQRGRRITWSPKVFVPLTRLCRDRCGYCTFAQPPARLESPYLELEEVLAIARAGAAAGCHEALFTLGERPEDRHPVARRWLSEHGHRSTIDYLITAARVVREETGLLPHANAGALFPEELAALRQVAPSQGMMLETLNADLDCHVGSPDKSPERRLATLEAAGRLAIPFTTGVLVGIGEDRRDRLAALEAIAESHRRFGHVQEVIVQNFLPKPGTAMHRWSPCPSEEHLWAIAAARLILPAEVHLQAPPNLAENLVPLLEAGIDDWGGVSPLTPDHVNPERPWPAVEVLRAASFVLTPRLTVHAEWAVAPERWVDPALHFAVADRSDAEGLARDPDLWCSGGGADPPPLLGASASGGGPDRVNGALASRPSRLTGPVAEVLAGVTGGQRVDLEEIVTLFSARGPEVSA
ncbi:MAG: 7,8-didemethyl-8-hydroxy-5-deazariboflavin synthase CofG, partial [Acidimicrobiales bacterium]